MHTMSVITCSVGFPINCNSSHLYSLHARNLQNSSSWQVTLRALYALEAVLMHGSSQACGEVAVMFQSDPSPVTRALSSSQPSVKERASKCLKLLLNDQAPEMVRCRAILHYSSNFEAFLYVGYHVKFRNQLSTAIHCRSGSIKSYRENG
jgi:hypothetical protein